MSKESFGIGIVLGAVTGFAAAYLLAPKSGEEFREDLSEKSKIAKRKTLSAADSAVNKTEGWLNEQIENQQKKTQDYVASRSRQNQVRDDYETINIKPQPPIIKKHYKDL